MSTAELWLAESAHGQARAKHEWPVWLFLSQLKSPITILLILAAVLSAIENFGSMNVLCSDKTGTITQGKVEVHATIDVQGNACKKVARYAFLKATFESGFANSIDEAIRFLTFGLLLFVMGSNETLFRTGWFLESVVSATLVVLIVKTRRPLAKSRPSLSLIIATVLAIVVILWLPWSPLAGILGFGRVPVKTLISLTLIVLGYVTTAEYAKQIFYRRMTRPR